MRLDDTRLPGPTTARVRVLLPLPLGEIYDYRPPADVALSSGDFVRVPLGSREVVGVVWDASEAGNDRPAVADSRLRAVLERLDCPAMPASLRRTVEWVAAYTLAPLGNVLRMAMAVPEALLPPRRRPAYVAGPRRPARLTPARQRIFDLLSDGKPRMAAEIAAGAAASNAVVRALVADGCLLAAALPPEAPFERPDPNHRGVVLSRDQRQAAEELVARVGENAFSVTLLEGVTGSGKTEAYFEAIATALRRGQESLILLPEIALTVQWFDRFVARFGVRPAVWHSDLSAAERRRTWRAVAEGRVPVLVGARSALFLPFANLGAIVVDEEHDASFKQEDGVMYQARDMAIVRARAANCPAVLVSATPSLETVLNVRQGRYRRLVLPDRHGAATLPEISILDLRRDALPAGRWISPTLAEALERTVANGEQALLFLNRRGYAPLTLCRACGHRLQCPNCQAWLVEHRHTGRLHCHHCDYAAERPKACPKCASEGRFAACGPGVERLAEEVGALLPTARLAVMASDILDGPAAMAETIHRIAARQVDVIVGTQIVAKGHHFPFLTLVGVVDADLGLAGGDLRAAERTFQLLAQVSGRAGRAERPGRAYLQTYMPDHPVMVALASGDRERFIAQELAARQAQGMPPFGRLAALILSSEKETRVDRAAIAVRQAAPRDAGLAVLGPAPAPLALLRGRHRRRLLVKAGRDVALQPALNAWRARVKLPPNVRLQIDVDPYSFL